MNIQSISAFNSLTSKKIAFSKSNSNVEKLPDGQVIVTDYWADGKTPMKRTLYADETLKVPVRFALYRADGTERIVHDAMPMVNKNNQKPVFKINKETLPDGQVIVTDYWADGKTPMKRTLYADETLKVPVRFALYRADGTERIVQNLLKEEPNVNNLDQSEIKIIKNDDGTSTKIEYQDDGVTPKKETKYSQGKIPTILEKYFTEQNGTIEEIEKYGMDGGFIERKYYPLKKTFITYI